MTYLLAVSLIANLLVVLAFLRDRKQTEQATRLERTALLQRIQAPETAVAMEARQKRQGKGWVNPFDDEEYWEHKKREIEARDAA